jgi:hypothetical protein
MSIEPSANNGTTTIIMESNALTQPMPRNGTQPISLLLPGDAMQNGNGNSWHDGIKEDTIGSRNNGTVNEITTTTATDVLNAASDNDTECQKVAIERDTFYYYNFLHFFLLWAQFQVLLIFLSAKLFADELYLCGSI